MLKRNTYRRILYGIVASVFFCWLGYYVFFWIDSGVEKSYIRKDERVVRLTDEDLLKLQTGDIILRRGYGLLSDIVADTYSSGGYEVTHAGFIIQEDGQWFVYHSLSGDVSKTDGVQKQLLKDFLESSQPQKIIISRVMGITPLQQEAVKQFATAYLGKGILFDRKGDYNHSQSLFCSEYIINVLGKDMNLISIPYKEAQKKEYYYRLKTLYDTLTFTQVINQFRN